MRALAFFLWRPRLGVLFADSRERTRCFSSGRILEKSSDGAQLDAEQRRQMLNRLLYRSKQRGFLELDLVLGKWTQDNIHHLDDARLNALVEVLDMENPDLWRYLTCQAQVPELLLANPVFVSIQKQILDNLHSFSSLKTRAMPGQPWVRGWDDLKKTGPNNTTGNQ